MNKKGDAWALQVLVAFSIILAVAVVIFWYAIPALRGGEEGAKSFLEQQVEMLKKTGQSDVHLASFTEEEKKKLEKEAPDALTTLKLSSYKKDFDGAINVNNFDEAREAIKNYKEIIDNTKNQPYLSQNDKDFVGLMLNKLSKEEVRYEINKARIEEEKAKIIGELNEEEKQSYNSFETRFKEISKVYGAIHVPGPYEKPRTEWIILSQDIAKLNSPKKAFKNLLAKTYFWIIKTFTSENRCDDRLLQSYFNVLKEDYSTFEIEGEGNVLKGTYGALMWCHDYIAFDQNQDVRKHSLAILDLWGEYKIRYPTVTTHESVKKVILKVGSVKCWFREGTVVVLASIFPVDRTNCQGIDRKNSIVKRDIYIFDRTLSDIMISRSDINKNPALGCYLDYDGGLIECLNCKDKNINKCEKYETGSDILGDDWDWACEDDPCAVGPCIVKEGWVDDDCIKA